MPVNLEGWSKIMRQSREGIKRILATEDRELTTYELQLKRRWQVLLRCLPSA